MSRKKVFVIMPFQDTFFEVYEGIRRKLGDKFDFSHAGEENNQQNILKDIIQPIHDSDIILADLTGLNPNVMYELALAHAFKKKTIIITRDQVSSLPFDLRSYRAKNYDVHFNKFDELIEYLDHSMAGAIDGTILYSNPVQDFLIESKIEPDGGAIQAEDQIVEVITDKGFLDYVADIENNAHLLTSEIQNLSKDMEQMEVDVEKSAQEMEKVDNSNNIVQFIRKNTKKAATAIHAFDQNLRGHNQNISKLWDEIERDTYGLIDSRFVKSDANKASLREYLQSLVTLQEAISNSNKQISGLLGSMEESTGIERSLTQAIRFTMGDLSTYLDITDHMASSISSIIDKGNKIATSEI